MSLDPGIAFSVLGALEMTILFFSVILLDTSVILIWYWSVHLGYMIECGSPDRSEGLVHRTGGGTYENGYIESVNGQPIDGLLNRETFYTLIEAKVLTER